MTAEAATKTTLALQKVLVVDDQPDTREALRLLLKSAGYAIEMAESPIHALAAAAYHDHDLILVDMNYTRDTTSGDEGLRLLGRLRARGKDPGQSPRFYISWLRQPEFGNCGDCPTSPQPV